MSDSKPADITRTKSISSQSKPTEEKKTSAIEGPGIGDNKAEAKAKSVASDKQSEGQKSLTKENELKPEETKSVKSVG